MHTETLTRFLASGWCASFGSLQLRHCELLDRKYVTLATWLIILAFVQHCAALAGLPSLLLVNAQQKADELERWTEARTSTSRSVRARFAVRDAFQLAFGNEAELQAKLSRVKQAASALGFFDPRSDT
ncbi:hypothetical protein IE81DRAFT_319976 [Ceraceosorus guamensis]|uniref:Uncharacterized protein n=1 Tax=Ceraceosorus guamensis TaxID=1522189 RepID=A0A316W9D2_9BASI|nr:hypothetical protein IE81DRAFT_319976 [Ceraceosorus guamensis]PWN45678.1 hypothetical protein IE81DRAFT_319976 [Ceraceosorus guamensis]